MSSKSVKDFESQDSTTSKKSSSDGGSDQSSDSSSSASPSPPSPSGGSLSSSPSPPSLSSGGSSSSSSSPSPPSPSSPSSGGSGSSSSSPPSKSSTPPPPKSSSSTAAHDTPTPPSQQNAHPTPHSKSSNSPPPPPSSSNKNTPYHPTPHAPGQNQHHSPPAPLSSTQRTPPSSSNRRDSSSESGVVGGAVVGGGVLLIIMIICLICCCRRKKRKQHPQMQYYNAPPGNRNDYYNSAQHGNWNNKPPQYPDQYPNMHHPPPQHSGVPGGEHGGWGQPPPPPPMMSSADMASSNFSGPYQTPMPPPHPAMALGYNKSSFTYDELATATGGFSRGNLLGQGGFGYVYKGTLQDGMVVAVKSLKSGSGQGEREFQAEVDIISRVHHRHLVSLVGYCISGSQRMLVYEYVSNKTLEHHLHGKDLPTMDFPSRLKIAIGAARGFAYLHEDCHPKIIHRDIKAANILLDDQFEAKVADFGLAKLSNDNHTHVSTRIMGTFGYLAPEYASSGKLTEKSDVYSYGIMLLELITGRRPVDIEADQDDTLVDWARPILLRGVDSGDYEEMVDPQLKDSYNHHEMLCMVVSAAACIRHSARRRPRMSQVVRALEGDVSLDDLNEGVKPGHSSMFGSSGSSELDGVPNGGMDMKKFKKVTASSQEFSSSGEHGLTGEFTINPAILKKKATDQNEKIKPVL